jgi:type IV pilus assembly protein PilM
VPGLFLRDSVYYIGMRFLNALSRVLPPPSYMSLPSVGVDISDTSMKYVAFKPTLRSDRVRVLDDWGDISIPENVLQRGEIKDPKILAEVLREFKSKTNADFIRVSLPEERAYIFETELKRNVPKSEIQSLLEFRLEENVPIAAREAIFDYEIVPSAEKSSVAKVVVAAYQRDTVMQYYEACRSAGLTPLSFEVEAQAMARAVVPEGNDDTVMLIDFGKTRTGVGIARNGVLYYTSTIDIGGGQLSTAMRKVLGDDVAESELTQIKNTSGLVRQVDDSRAYEALISTISVIKDEIASRMQYWHTEETNRQARRIKKVYLCGGSVNLKGLPEYLTESLGVTCVRADVWSNAFKTSLVVPPMERRFSYGYATAVGLALKNTV